MPQVSDNFGPIYQTVVLDGNGYGAVQFQATGSAIRLSNITFAVSSVNAQAVCVIYKGQIATGNRVFNSNSGSTGGNAQGNVDLFDGETCFVEWSGGDPGATATATFTGGKIPFGDMRPSLLEGQDPVAAGDGSLIFPALKSPNYVAGVSGWQLDRDGDIELNDAVIRGELLVSDPDGSYVRIYDQDPGDGALVEFGLPTGIGLTRTPGSIFSSAVTAYGEPGMIIKSPTVNGTPFAVVNLISDTTADESLAVLAGTRVRVSAEGQFYISAATMVTSVGFGITIGGPGTTTVEGDLVVEGQFSRPNATVTFGTPTITTGGAGAQILTATAVLDTYGMVSGGGVTVDRDGLYDLGVLLQYTAQAASAGFRQCYVFVNGTELMHERVNVATNFNNDTPSVSFTIPATLNQGDVVTFGAYHTAGVSLSITSASRGWVVLREDYP